jgi:predicted DNA-binding transcriptional regulator AlpA
MLNWHPYDRFVSQPPDLVSTAEIAQLLQVSRQRIDKLSRTDATFPHPVAELHAGRIWLLKDVQDWIRMSGRKLP